MPKEASTGAKGKGPVASCRRGYRAIDQRHQFSRVPAIHLEESLQDTLADALLKNVSCYIVLSERNVLERQHL